MHLLMKGFIVACMIAGGEDVSVTCTEDAAVWGRKGFDVLYGGKQDAAIPYFTKAIEVDPQCKEAYLGRAMARSINGNLDGAIEDYTMALEIDGLYIEAWEWRGDVKKAKGDIKGANEDYEGSKLARAEKNRKRLEEFNKAIEAEPTKAELYRERADFKVKIEDLEGAIEDFDKYIELAGRPDGFEVVRRRAMTKERLGDIDGAIADYTLAMGWFPDRSDPYNARATLRRTQGDMEGARADWEMARVKREAQERRRHLEQIEALVASIEKNPNDVPAYMKCAELRLRVKDYRGILADTDRAIALDGDNAQAYFLRSTAKRRLGDMEGSEADLKKMKELRSLED